ncbi:uncharacterized protein LOC109858110 isoform X2 [Pseudomyrmex gracilis]|uniref:uncharacterized protein LOC109858110 isoform X2 n=1 Tax=Pseudomyrmex gracilis TaxID=219809 RepID=UPI000995B865|nr:uncharacterized protein LOC109858110 isoform X2 [Pseudomyrmex gracilis]
MDSEVFFQEYAISEKTVARLESIREALKDNIIRANPMWKLLAGENKEEMCSEDEDNDEDDKSNNSESQLMFDQLMPSTQFYFTQVERIIEKPKRPVDTVMQKCDILESVCENLERNNGRMNFAQLENLSSDDFVLLVDELTKKLSLKGIYNLCQSMMNDMTVQQEMKYLNTLCTHLLLPKIVQLKEPSRLLSSAIRECIRKFPDEIQRFIYIPILNTELKDTTLITIIINAFDSQRKPVLIEKFLTYVEELKLWHIPILQNFLSVRFDSNMIDKVTKLFLEKAVCYSKNKNFGKLILSFLKSNTTLSEEQKNRIAEVAAVNETFFKKLIENILSNM